MIEEFLTFNGFIYKKVADVNSIFKICPHCHNHFFTKEQRKIYCSGACKTRAHRDRQ
jgi:hypothetical protein